jgi:hypothetical protein
MVEEKKNEYELVEVPTQMGIAIKNPQGELLTTEQAIVEILNRVNSGFKSLGA